MKPCMLPLVFTLLTANLLYSCAEVVRYKNEAAYIARLTELGFEQLQENFENTSWNHVRSSYPTQNFVTTVTSKRLQWRSAGNDLWSYPTETALISTNPNWARGEGWGIFDNFLASTLRITSPEPIFGIGFWVNTNPDLQDVGILFPEQTIFNEPGYPVTGFGVMYPGDIHPAGHGFVGFVDADGFTNVVVTGTLEVNEEGQLEGGTVFGADDFSFAVAEGFYVSPHERWLRKHFAQIVLDDPSLEVTIWGDDADPDLDNVENWREYLFGDAPLIDDHEAMLVEFELSVDGLDQRFQFTVNRRVNDPALVYSPAISSDLITWFGGPMNVEEISSTLIGDNIERVVFRAIGTLPDPNRVYARVAVDQIP